jgi:NAD(P)-dependent dehydrogenase (short-subunit alcohol dehydrogenase family)
MKDFQGRTAVITGAASGIGRGLAERAAREGMNVVLADVEEEPLAQTAAMLEDSGANVLAVHTDVSQSASVEALAQQALDRFGAVHLLCSNAGVGSPGRTVWKHTVADWEWVLGVNLWGAIHCARVFVPIMLAQEGDSHIVNTASIAGLTSSPWRGAYAVSKHGVVTLSEMMHQELALESNGRVNVSVLCPGLVSTGIQTSKRNRPGAFANTPEDDVQNPGFRAWIENTAQRGISPSQAAEIVFNAVEEQRFYILTHPELKEFVRDRMDAVLNDQDPTGISE